MQFQQSTIHVVINLISSKKKNPKKIGKYSLAYPLKKAVGIIASARNHCLYPKGTDSSCQGPEINISLGVFPFEVND